MKSQSYTKPSKEKLIDLASKRYKRMEGKIPFSIKALSQSKDFEKTFNNLKKKGYPDWAIYMAVLNISVNLRLLSLQKQGMRNLEYLKKAFQNIIDEEEKPEEVIPVSEVTEEKIEMAIDLIIMSFLRAEGFESRKTTPNIKALRNFTENELDFFKYDLPHKKWFDFEEE